MTSYCSISLFPFHSGAALCHCWWSSVFKVHVLVGLFYSTIVFDCSCYNVLSICV